MSYNERTNYKLCFDDPSENTLYKDMMEIAKEWDRKELELAIDEGILEEVLILDYDSAEGELYPIGEFEMEWKEFFNEYDECKKELFLERKGIVPSLIKKIADISIDWDKYLLVYEEGMAVPEREDHYTYDEIMDFYKQGMFFVNLETGKRTAEEIIDIENEVWTTITVDDALKLIDLDEDEINQNIQEGNYGTYRKSGDVYLFSLKAFSKYHNLV